MQAELNDKTFAKNAITDGDGAPLTMARIAADRALREEWVQKYNLAMRQECAELVDSTNWKWWRSKVDLFDEQNVKVELVDILHFWISACQVMGMSADDVVRMYLQKNEVNHQRQDKGYVTKDENDSRHIG